MKLGKLEYEPVSPRDIMATWEVARLATGAPERAAAAAIMVCWPDDLLRRPKVTMAQCSYDVGDYGAKVTTALVAAGCTLGEITTAGLAAMRLVLGAAAESSRAVQAAENFSSPKPETSAG